MSYAFVLIEDRYQLISTSGMRSQQAIVRFNRHRLEKGFGNISNEIDVICMCDGKLCLFIKAHPTRDFVDPDRIAPQEGGRHDYFLESRAKAFHHVFYCELGEVIRNLDGIYGGGFDWVDESEEGFEDLCGFCDLDYGEVGFTFYRLRWLREGKHVMKNRRGGRKDSFVNAEVLELGCLGIIRMQGHSKDDIRVRRVECVRRG